MLIISQHTNEKRLVSASFSKPALEGTARRVRIKPVTIRNTYMLHMETDDGKQVKQRNVELAEAVGEIGGLLKQYHQAVIAFTNEEFQILSSSRGSCTIKRISRNREALPAEHDRKKTRIFAENEPVPFLVALGIMNSDGYVRKEKYDKYRQINRFVELVSDILPEVLARHNTDRPLRIIDFGCGKAYLSFALHHYLTTIKNLNVHITGLDLKQEVVTFCETTARKLDCVGLGFQTGDIANYVNTDPVDMVITLHACDTATDLALAQAIHWGAQAILCAPCCQHELFGQLNAPLLNPLVRHGLLKERFASLATDALRAEMLTSAGYDTQVLEFVDPEHTPKNIMLRAVKHQRKVDAKRTVEWQVFSKLLGAQPCLEKQLADKP